MAEGWASSVYVRPFRMVQSVVNVVLPFARPSTPLWQDLTHAAAVCAVLYYAPDLFSPSRRRRLGLVFDRITKPVRFGRPGLVSPGTDSGDGPSGVLESEPGPDDQLGLDWDAGTLAQARQPHVVDDDDDQDDADVGRTTGHGQPDPGWEAQFEHGDFDYSQYPIEDDLGAHAGLDSLIEGASVNGNVRRRQPFPAGADGTGPTAASRTRIVGTKKAKSLARRESRRAYHEYVRHVSDMQRTRDQSFREATAADREAAAARREQARVAFDDRVRAEREERKRREQAERDDFDAVVACVRRLLLTDDASEVAAVMADEHDADEPSKVDARPIRAVSLSTIVARIAPGRTEEWVEQAVRRGGIVGPISAPDPGPAGPTGAIILTQAGVLVRADRADMDRFYRRLEQHTSERTGGQAGTGTVRGVVSADELPAMLEGELVQTGRMLL